MKRKLMGGYSANIVQQYLDLAKPIYCISTELTVKYQWKDGAPTEKIDGYKGWFCQEGVEPFAIKFPDNVALPPFLTKVELKGLEACEVRRNVYFRAVSVKEAK